MQATEKVAVATFVMRGRQHLSVVSPQDNFLMLNTLRFANEVLPPVIKETGKASVSAAELAMATQLVDGMSGAFRPEQFKDTYRADLLRKVKEKIKKKQTHSLESDSDPTSSRPKAQVIDLMEALKNSLKLKSQVPFRPEENHQTAQARLTIQSNDSLLRIGDPYGEARIRPLPSFLFNHWLTRATLQVNPSLKRLARFFNR